LGPGRVKFEGRDIFDADEATMRKVRGQDIALIFQDPMAALNPVLTIGEQISEAIRAHQDLSKQAVRQRTIELLTLVGIPGAEQRLGWYPHQFSGGMRQRVMIASAISCSPKVILADEVTTALDVTIQAQILELLKSLSSKLNTSMVLISHDLGVVAGMAQRVYVMYAGRVVEAASTDDLFDNPSMPYTWGLLRSVPRLEHDTLDRLVPIEGVPPDASKPVPGCRFQPRCAYRRDVCAVREPELLAAAGSSVGHMTRCWGRQDVKDGGWLAGADWKVDLGDAQLLDEIRSSASVGG
jgi:oligopeptide transport system ATP-binding protein